MRILALGVLALACGRTGDAPVDQGRVADSAQANLASLVIGCLEVPPGFHSYSTQNLFDAFSGRVATGPEAEPLLNWATGKWNYDFFLSAFEPKSPKSAQPVAWKARRNGADFLVIRYEPALLFGKFVDDAEADRLRSTLTTYRTGSKACAGAERATPVAKAPALP